MPKPISLSNDSAHWYISEITSRIVAESGIPSDRYHLGKIILHNFRDDPNFVLQIDGATDESETCGSVLERTVRCANAFRNLGLEQGDKIALMAPNHLDVGIPFYAALYLGVVVAAVDRTLTANELQGSFSSVSSKIVFCQSEKAPEVQLVLNQLNMNALIVTFDKGDYLESFAEFLAKHGDGPSVDDFKPSDFNSEEATAFLITTSGSTGFPKSAVITHKNFAVATPYVWIPFNKFPTPVQVTLIVAPLQWLTALIMFIGSAVMRITRVQSSQAITQQHTYHLINKYKPGFTIISPNMLTTLIKPGDREQCDFTCFERIYVGGNAVPQNMIDEFKQLTPQTSIRNTYGMSEVAGLCFYSDAPAPGSSGKPLGSFQYRLVDVETQTDITEPKVQGELWVKGPTVFKEYYKNPEITEETFAEDRWFKTGDLFYRDDQWNFYFVDRIKLLLKYKIYQISPVEVEDVIRQHPGVMDAAVAGILDPQVGDLCVAFVVRRPNSEVTAHEVKDFVAENLSDYRRLRGGVIFIDAVPVLANTKVNRKKIKEMVLMMPRE